MSLQAQLVITQLVLLATIVLGLWNFITLHKTVQSLWDMVKDLQRERRIH